ncbi:N-methyl-L-tryptophan oxidase [Leuconostocaceae bacterium ESL0723]|nr:N-methyl-L-tryptophan oxidase [Leuconostocaceae bacterium ESL0723]
MPEVYDLAVLGTGSVGSAAGYYASLAGKSVLELDRQRPPHDQGSHHGATRIIRYAYGEGDYYLPLLLAAKRLWLELQDQTGADIFHQTGVLNVGPKGDEFIETVVKSAQKYQLPVEYLAGEDLNQRWPALHFDDSYKAVYEADAGYLNSEIAIQTYLDLAKQQGVTQDFSSPVTQLNCLDNGLVKITNAQQSYYAREVILTAGSWIKTLVPTLPVQVMRKVFTWFATDEPSLEESQGFPAFSIRIKNGATYYGFPAKDGTIKIGKHDGGQPLASPAQRTKFGAYPEDLLEIGPLLDGYLGGVKGIDYGDSCTYDMSPDGDFIIDNLPNHPQVKMVTGLSGHGFKFVSVLGKVLADQLDNGKTDFDLSPFSLKRFQSE